MKAKIVPIKKNIKKCPWAKILHEHWPGEFDKNGEVIK